MGGERVLQASPISDRRSPFYFFRNNKIATLYARGFRLKVVAINILYIITCVGLLF